MTKEEQFENWWKAYPRRVAKGNAAQELKLAILSDIHSDYQKSLERAREKQVRGAEDGS